MDGHYVDRVEKKLLSPDKECINPNKAFADAAAKEKLKDAKLPEDDAKAADSGLDSSANSDEAHDTDKFVDRREDVLAMGEPEVILSPPKVRDHQFNFVDNQSQSRLDAVNNNEVAVEWTESSDEVNKPPGSPDCYLGKIVSLHDNSEAGPKENQVTSMDVQLKSRNKAAELESTMNMYWYSTTLDLDIDPKELEDFKTTQATSPSYTTTFNMSIGDGYYREKSQGKELPVSDNRFTESVVVQKVSEEDKEHEIWSSAFESASSRFLDLASELNTEPKSVKNRENTSIKKGENGKEPHPWGLDGDTRVKTETVPVLTDELPALEGVIADSNVDILMVSERKEDVVDGKQGDVAEDMADAVGYMELADKDKIIKQEKKYASKGGNGKKGKGKGKASEKAEKVKDEVDAVGYMEKVDKPIIEMLNVSESSQLNFVQTSVSMDRKDSSTKSEISSATNVSILAPGGKESDVDAGVTDMDVPDSGLGVQEELVKEVVEKVEAKALKMVDTKVMEEVFEPTGIERTFKTAEDTEDRIIDAGGKLIYTEKIIDEYLDDSNFSLTLKDCWLRFRNKRLEMKLNASQHCSQDGQSEISEVSEIRKTLVKKFPKTLKKADEKKQIAKILSKAGLVEFVTHETVRKRYQVGDCVVMLDQTDFGFQVGQIEATARNPSRVVGMLGKMKELAQKLNLRPLQSL